MRCLGAVVLCMIAGPALAAPPPVNPRAIVGLAAYPKAVKLSHRHDRQRIVVVTRRGDGVTGDVSTKAAMRVEPPTIAKLVGCTLTALRDGAAVLVVRHGAHEVRVPIAVKGAAAIQQPQFTRDVMPVLTRGGCNSGTCHGSARGKDGFMLSLFGYDPKGDYYRITRQQVGRRVDLGSPDDSLILAKASGRVRHTGGERVAPGSAGYEMIRRWITSGALPDPKNAPRLTGIALRPPEMVLESGDRQALVVVASYSDGTTRDVTDQAVFFTNNGRSACVEHGGVIADVRGEAFLTARYGEYTVGSQAIVIPEGSAPPAFDAGTHEIDRLIADKLRKLRLAPAALCDDRTFLRRVTLDLNGRLPSLAELQAFGADKRPDKRTRLIDRLLGRKEFVELRVLEWAEKLQIRSSNRVSVKSTHLYHSWLRKKLEANTPMNEVVRELLSATGSTFTAPASNFYYIESDTKKLAENVAQAFLGMRIQCAQCHNHPFDRWTQNDYYGFVAFFSRVTRKRGQDPREWIVFDRYRGETVHPVSKRAVTPRFLGGAEQKLPNGSKRREVLARWLTSDANPAFARHLANVVWARLMGRGIVDEVDDVRVSNPPCNPALLDALGQKLVALKYDIKQLVRFICTSRAYQRSTRGTKDTLAAGATRRDFGQASIRRLRAEVLLDCIVSITGDQPKFPGLPRGARAVQIVDGRTSTYFLTTFGRPRRESVCACELRLDPTLSQALHLLNGQTVHAGIRRGQRIGRMIKAKKTAVQIVEQLYLECLSRPMTAKERAALLPKLAKTRDKASWLEDLLWALLNSREFVFNH